jgi:hypothetical protein
MVSEERKEELRKKYTINHNPRDGGGSSSSSTSSGDDDSGTSDAAGALDPNPSGDIDPVSSNPDTSTKRLGDDDDGRRKRSGETQTRRRDQTAEPGSRTDGRTDDTNSSDAKSKHSQKADADQKPTGPDRFERGETVDARNVPAGQLTAAEVRTLNRLGKNPNVSDEQLGQVRDQFTQNNAVVEQQAAYELQKRVIREQKGVDNPNDVEVRRTDEGFLARQTPASVRENLAADLVESSAAVDDPGDVAFERRDGQVVARTSDAAIREQVAGQNADVAPGEVSLIRGSKASAFGKQGVVPTAEGDQIVATVDQEQSASRPAGDRTEVQQALDLAGTPENPRAADPVAGEGRQAPRQETQSQASTRIQLQTQKGVSPVASMGVPEGEMARAEAGAQAVTRRANRGDFFAQVAVIGRRSQESIDGIREFAEDAVPGTDVGPAVAAPGREGEATAGEQIVGAPVGLLAFPSKAGAAGVEAAGVAGTEPSAIDADAPLAGTTEAAARSQVEFVLDRPIEAGIIGAAALGASSGARGKARAAASRARRSARSGAREFASDTRAKAEVAGGSRQRSGEIRPRGEELDTGLDTRIFERKHGRRPGRSGLEGRQKFAKRVRTRKMLQHPSTQVNAPDPGLRTVPVEGTAGSGLAGEIAAFRSDIQSMQNQAQEPAVTVDNTAPTGRSGQAGTADGVTQDLQELVSEAQRPEVRLDDEVVAGDKSLAPGVGDVDATQGLQERLAQAQRQETSATARERGRGRGRGENATGRGRGRQDQRQRTDVRNETPTERTTGNPKQRPVTDIFDVQRGGPGRGRRGPPRDPGNPRVPRQPGIPGLPGLGVGGGSGGSGRGGGTRGEEDGLLAAGWLSETTETIATQGRETPETPSQTTLARQPRGLQLTGELPTQGIVEGDAAVAETQALLSFEGIGVGPGEGEASTDAFFAFGDEDDGGGLL